jgi:hypothetical protein
MLVMTCPQASQSRQISEETIVKLNELGATKEIAAKNRFSSCKEGPQLP